MRDRIVLPLVLFLIFAVHALALSESALSAETPPENNDREGPVTTANPAIPETELAILLRPLSKIELLREAEGWQSLVQETAQKIAQAEIAVQRENLEIDKEDKLTQKVRQTQQQLEQLVTTAQEARKEKSLVIGIEK